MSEFEFQERHSFFVVWHIVISLLLFDNLLFWKWPNGFVWVFLPKFETGNGLDFEFTLWPPLELTLMEWLVSSCIQHLFCLCLLSETFLKGFSSSYFADLKLSFTKMSCLIFIKNSWMSSLKNPLLNSISYIKKGHRILILSLLFKRLSCFPSNLFVNVTLEKSILTRCFSYMSCMIMQPKNFLLLLPFLYTKVAK